MSKYLEIHNDQGYLQLNDSYTPVTLVRKGTVSYYKSLSYPEMVSDPNSYPYYTIYVSKIAMADNEYLVAYRNPTTSGCSLHSFVTTIGGVRYSILYSFKAAPALEYYVFGKGSVTSTSRSGLQIFNAQGDPLYCSDYATLVLNQYVQRVLTGSPMVELNWNPFWSWASSLSRYSLNLDASKKYAIYYQCPFKVTALSQSGYYWETLNLTTSYLGTAFVGIYSGFHDDEFTENKLASRLSSFILLDVTNF